MLNLNENFIMTPILCCVKAIVNENKFSLEFSDTFIAHFNVYYNNILICIFQENAA